MPFHKKNFHKLKIVCLIFIKILISYPKMDETFDDIEYLDKEFNKSLEKMKQIMLNYNSREKYICTRWLAKLKKSNSSAEEKKLRNRFITYFLNNEENEINVFTLESFKILPQDFNEPLMKLQKLLPKVVASDEIGATKEQDDYNVMELLNSLPDKGKFLNEQPVPLKGSFYITIFKPIERITCPRPYNISQDIQGCD
ncbi:uncharacterized protein [Musca autumnalis]|uniref:uncharacterized protein n=1 Tax=Musca autumnalis TaxID=221902 RepID=UPI003CF4E0F4